MTVEKIVTTPTPLGVTDKINEVITELEGITDSTFQGYWEAGETVEVGDVRYLTGRDNTGYVLECVGAGVTGTEQPDVDISDVSSSAGIDLNDCGGVLSVEKGGTGATKLIRKKNSSYDVGDVVYNENNGKVALKCTTAGTTSNAELDISTKTIGDTVTDGSVVWQVCNRISDVTSVNGKTGDVIIPEPNYPVTSVNGMTGDVEITIPEAYTGEMSLKLEINETLTANKVYTVTGLTPYKLVYLVYGSGEPRETYMKFIHGTNIMLPPSITSSSARYNTAGSGDYGVYSEAWVDILLLPTATSCTLTFGLRTSGETRLSFKVFQ